VKKSTNLHFLWIKRRKKQERKTMRYILHTSFRQNILGEKWGQYDLGSFDIQIKAVEGLGTI